MNTHSEFKTADAESYDALAETFDHYTDRFSYYAVDAILNELEPRHQTILDLGCGSGVAALSAAQKSNSGSSVTGVDLSKGMLDFARSKADQLSLGDSVKFVEGDAENLPFEAGEFNAAISLYAFRHFPNPVKAAQELYRVLAPGGRAVIAVGSRPNLISSSGLQVAIKTPMRKLRAMLGKELTACDQIERLVESELPAPSREEEAAWTVGHHGFSESVQEIVEQAGFVVKSSKWFGAQYVIQSASEFWDLQSTFSSKARKRLANASPTDRALVKQKFTQECDTVLGRGGQLIYRVGAVIVTGDKVDI